MALGIFGIYGVGANNSDAWFLGDCCDGTIGPGAMSCDNCNGTNSGRDTGTCSGAVVCNDGTVSCGTAAGGTGDAGCGATGVRSSAPCHWDDSCS